jgi:hypothetical protein
MPVIIDRRATARIDGDFVVFLMGMRINKPSKVDQWLLVLMAMPQMSKEVDNAPPEAGFLAQWQSASRPGFGAGAVSTIPRAMCGPPTDDTDPHGSISTGA